MQPLLLPKLAFSEMRIVSTQFVLYMVSNQAFWSLILLEWHCCISHSLCYFVGAIGQLRDKELELKRAIALVAGLSAGRAHGKGREE